MLSRFYLHHVGLWLLLSCQVNHYPTHVLASKPYEKFAPSRDKEYFCNRNDETHNTLFCRLLTIK